MPAMAFTTDKPALNRDIHVQRDIAFVFPGQGSQRAGMLADAAQTSVEVRATFDEASQALGYDLWDLVRSDDDGRLDLTEYTQPALLTSSVALWRSWRAAGGKIPGAMAGHSLGEFSALCCAGVFELADALVLVRERGKAMQSAVPVGEGAMAAVLGLDDEPIMAICATVAAELDAVVQAVNFNAPGQVVIAGHAPAVEVAIGRLKAAGAKRAVALNVSAPFHTSLMQPAGERLAQVLDGLDLHSPSIPVVHNVNARPETDPGRIRDLLVEQISSPVGWTACVRALLAGGATRFLECGPGRVLGGLLRRIDRALVCDYLEAPADLQAAVIKGEGV